MFVCGIAVGVPIGRFVIPEGSTAATHILSDRANIECVDGHWEISSFYVHAQNTDGSPILNLTRECKLP
jgi:hypothetical protein